MAETELNRSRLSENHQTQKLVGYRKQNMATKVVRNAYKCLQCKEMLIMF